MKRLIHPVVTALSLSMAAGHAADPAAAPAAVPAPPANAAPAPAEKPGPKTPPPKIDIQVKKGKDRSKASSQSTLETFEFEVVVRSLTPGVKMENAGIQLYVLGVSNANENLYNVINVQQEQFELTPKEHTLVTPLLKLKYTSSGGGMKLGGYLVVVTDPDGNVLGTKATRASFEKNIDTIRGAKVSTTSKASFRM
ncbi:MAG: hypothetical protein U1F77_11105 [Kiritimatiellia bacterium]